MDWTGKRVLVTGAGGFIGSHLAERLVELGASTRAMVRYNSAGARGWLEGSAFRDELEIVASDVTDADGVRTAMRGVDAVFHLAALIGIPYSYDAPRSYVRTNVEGTLNVLQASRDEGVERVVHTSTSEVYGTALRVPIDEEHPLQGQSPYSASKIGADKMAEAFHRSFELPVVVVRPFNTFGPRQSARAVIPTIISQLLAGADELRLGNLAPTRDFNYVQNTVDGFVAAAEHPAAVGEVINLGTGREISIGDLVTSLMDVIGRQVRVIEEVPRVRPCNSEVERLLADVGKAARLLDWTPRVTLEQGLRATIEWIASHQGRYRPDEYAV
jgi:NAD dependent epimerase/dehydratase